MARTALALETGAVEATLPDGATRKLTEETDFETFIAIFGDLLKSVLFESGPVNGIFQVVTDGRSVSFRRQQELGRPIRLANLRRSRQGRIWYR